MCWPTMSLTTSISTWRKRFWMILNTRLDKARRALARFIVLHPENLAQKAEIVIEHFRTKIAHRMAGHAKAMVVCSSRPHAVRMWETLRKQITNNGYDLGVLVAFSGEVEDLTESRANGFSRIGDRHAVRHR